MKPKTWFDPEFSANSKPRRWPVRAISLWLTLLAVSGLTLAVMAKEPRRQVPKRRAAAKFSRNAHVFLQPGRGPQPKLLLAQPRDPFVMPAAADLDTEMVVPAPAEIDERMVVHADTGGQPQLMSPPLVAPIVPGPGQELSPIPYGPLPPEEAPLLPGPAKPR